MNFVPARVDLSSTVLVTLIFVDKHRTRICFDKNMCDLHAS